MEGEEFRRVTTEGPSRREMLSSLGSYAVPHGKVKDLVARVRRRLAEDAGETITEHQLMHVVKVVVYLDERAHRGEGKVLRCALDAEVCYPDHYASLYVAEEPGLSYRSLKIGKRWFWLCYQKPDPRMDCNPEWWMSNVGPRVRISLLGEFPGIWGLKFPPLLAIDWVPTRQGIFAIDYNIAPGIKGTGIEEVLRPAEVYELIREEMEKGRCQEE